MPVPFRAELADSDWGKRMVPNIFRYATKELSQDAVVCWLVACAREASGDLRECGLSFVHALMRSGGGRVINARSGKDEVFGGNRRVIGVVGEPRPQYGKIDVYFQAELDGKVVSFVVEDKTHTEMHGKQLERHRSAVGEDTIEEDLVKAVYFKTGYVFGDERERAELAGYSVFDAEDMVTFFGDGAWSATHDFVRDFAEHVAGLVNARRQALAKWDLNEAFVQWEFMVALGEALGLSDIRWPARSFNLGGSAWTQYPHYERRGSLFWRLDSWKPLRLMVDTHEVGGERALASWDGWDRAFREATERCGLDPAPFRRVRSRSGNAVAGGTIGAVDARASLLREGLGKCVERVGELHRRFVEESGPVLT